jgi:hypothetical protein
MDADGYCEGLALLRSRESSVERPDYVADLA